MLRYERILKSAFSLERTLELQRSYICQNSYGFSILAFSQGLAGIFYADYIYAGMFSTFGMLAILFGFFASKFTPTQYSNLGELLLISSVFGCFLILPQGAASAILLFPLGVALLSFCLTITRGIFLYTLSVLICLACDYFSIGLVEVEQVPALVSFLISFIYCTVALYVQVGNAKVSIDSALTSIANNEIALEHRRCQLRDHRSALNIINSKLERSTIFLNDTVKQEASLTSLLALKVDDQEQLTNAIHNDLRQPLRSIVSFSQLIQKKLEGRELASGLSDYMGFAVDGGQRMTRMLDDLLMYTSGTTSAPAQRVDLNLVLESLLFDLQDLIKRTNATIEIEQLPTVLGFHTQLVQLFQNLLANSLKFTRPGVPPHVKVFTREVEENNGKYAIYVADNGVGIAPSDISKVFGLFNRAHQDQGFEGSGVGLALCRRIAVAHGAELTLTSIQGEGTTFKLCFNYISPVFEESSVRMPNLTITKTEVNSIA